MSGVRVSWDTPWALHARRATNWVEEGLRAPASWRPLLFFALPERLAAHGQVTTTRRLRLKRDRWEATERAPAPITGLTQCLPLFGLPADGRPERHP